MEVSTIFWIAFIPIVLAAMAGAFLAFSRGKVYVEIVSEIMRKLTPKIVKLFHPKDFTKRQLDKIRHGENPFNDRSPGTGKDG